MGLRNIHTRVVLVCLIFLSNVSFSQSVKRNSFKCKDCDMSDAANIDSKDIQEKPLYCFIQSFYATQCKNNAEYAEYANPKLFDILLCNSTALINLLIKYPELNKKSLHNEIQSPLLDYDIKRIIFVVDSSNKKSNIKQQIIADLNAIKLDEHGYPH